MAKKLNIDVEGLIKALVPAMTESMTKAIINVLEAVEPEEVVEARYEGYVPKEAVKSYRQRNDFPEFLDAKEVSALTRISKPKVYEMFRRPDFPINIWGKTKRVDKTALLEYMHKNMGMNLTPAEVDDE